jgi:hypothetical protein
MSKLPRYAVTVFLVGAIGAGWLGGAGASAARNDATTPASPALDATHVALLEEEPCMHRYEAYMAKLGREAQDV